jgi:hypothetical protein
MLRNHKPGGVESIVGRQYEKWSGIVIKLLPLDNIERSKTQWAVRIINGRCKK